MTVASKPFAPESIVDVLRRHCIDVPDKIAYRYLDRGEQEAAVRSFAQLYRNGCAIASWLCRQGMGGRHVVILLPDGVQFIEVFIGCLMAKAVAIPLAVPGRNKSFEGLKQVIANSAAACIVTTRAEGERISTGLMEIGGNLAWLYVEDCDQHSDRQWREPSLNGEDIAFIQYTSGSTGQPKGVVVSHHNLLCNEMTIKEAMQLDRSSVIVNWLPLFHDMGLIGSVLQPLYLGASCITMAPTAFIQKPVRWLQAITRYKATTTGGPNFAYDLCLSRITESQRESLDLGSLTVAFTGAEPIRASTVERFTETYRRYGFNAKAFFPCYGMAEHTLYISGSPQLTGVQLKTLDADALARHQAKAATAATKKTATLVCCGVTQRGTELRIVDPETRRALAEGTVGEIWVKSDSVAKGYWRNHEQTEKIFRGYLLHDNSGPFLRTGDLGFIEAGQLYVTGRCKDVIIIRGRNYYPQDIEAVVQCAHPLVAMDSCAAFSTDADNNEELIVVAELTREGWWSADLTSVRDDVREAVAKHFELRPYRIVLIKPGTLPRTTSGKVRRSHTRRLLLDDQLIAAVETKQSSRSARRPSSQAVEHA